MAKEVYQSNKKELAISPKRVIKGIVKGIGSLLGLAAELERQGKSEYIEQGEIKGRTKSGKDIRGIYGWRVKLGLNPEEFRRRKRLKNGIK